MRRPVVVGSPETAGTAALAFLSRATTAAAVGSVDVAERWLSPNLGYDPTSYLSRS